MIRYLLSLIFVISAHFLLSQDCSVGAVSYCYDNDEDVTFTYCPDNPATQVIAVTLQNYGIENGYDLLTIYDGSGTSGDVLAEIESVGTSGYSYIGTPTADGGDGCVTLRFESDNSVSCSDGDFSATTWNVACQTICNPPTASLSASTNQICATSADNQTNPYLITFSAQGSTHADGSSFTSYDWDFGDGNILSTATPVCAHSFSNEGGFIASLVVTDNLGCVSTNLVEILIEVAGPPTFTLTSDADPGGVCPGTDVTLTAVVTPYEWEEPQVQPNPDPTELPDGTGSSYTSQVVFNQFGTSDIIEDGSNMIIMLDIEHSYMGDLDIEVVCPNGTRVELLDFSSNTMNNCNVGGAGEYDDGEGPPGDGAEYYFDSSAGTDFSSFSGPGSTSATGVDIPAGTYAPDESFTGFNGCPINGTWTVQITDNYNLDDGTLFTWSVELGPTDITKISLESFSTSSVSQSWSGEGASGNTATPTSEGTIDYTLTYTDDFGCEFTEITSVEVVNLPGCNEGPIATDDTDSTNEDTGVIIDVADNDSDSDGTIDLTSITITEQPNNGTLTINGDGTVTYSPDANYNGTDEFSYQICDNSGGCDQADVSLTVLPINDAPTVIADNDSVDEDGSVIVDVLDNDNDDLDPLGGIDAGSVTIDSDPSNGSVTVNGDGTITYTPDANFNGSDSFTYQVCDSGNPTPVICDQALVNITVNPINDEPSANDDTAATDEDTPVAIDILANDNDDIDPLGGIDTDSVTITSGPSNGEVTVNGDGTVTYTPDAGYNGGDSFTYQVCDTGNPTPALCDEAVVTLTVNDINDNPSLADDLYDLDEDTFAILDVLDNDDDSDGTLDITTVSIDNAPDYGTAIVNLDGTITYTPDTNFNGADAFTYEVCDDDGACLSATVTVTVNPINDEPSANDDTATTDEDTPVAIDILANDNDDIDPLGGIDTGSVTITSAPTNGEVTVNGNGTVTYTPDAGYNGGDSFTYQVCDSGNPTPALCDEAVVTLTVNDINDDPSLADDDYTIDEDTFGIFSVLDNDDDADGLLNILTLVIDNAPNNGTAIVNLDGTITYTPDTNFNGADAFTYEVCDDDGACLPADVTITVNPINDDPIANDDSGFTEEDTATTIDVLDNDNDDSDPNGGIDTSTITITVQPTNGSVEINPDGTITYTPEPDYGGVDVFTYQVCDSGFPLPALCDEAVVTILVNIVNDAPTINDDAAEIDEDESGIIAVLDNDFDTDGSIDITTLVITNAPTNGTAVVNLDGTITYTPDGDFNGDDTFTYQVCDDLGGCETAQVLVTVNPINDEPSANDDTAVTDEDTPVAIEVLANDNDDIDPLGGIDSDSITITSDPSNGEVTVNENGTVTYTPNENFFGSDSFTYEVCDTGNPLPALCDEAVVTITINDLNDNPGPADDAYTIDEDTTGIFDILSNDEDEDGFIDPTTVSITNGPTNGTLEVNDDGTVTYISNPDFNGIDTFTYEVCDDDGDCSTADVIITVLPVNDAPSANDDTASLDEDGEVIIDVLDNDNDALDPFGDIDPNSTTITVGPENGTVEINDDGTLTYIPNADFNGEDTFTYQVCDDGNPLPAMCDEATVTITVNPINDTLLAADDEDTTQINVSVTTDVLLNDSDPQDPAGEIDPTTLTVITDPIYGTATVNPDGTITYTPSLDFEGNDSYTYEVCDDGNPLPALCDTAVVWINVNNNSPLPGDDAFEIYEDETSQLDILANDFDPQDNIDTGSCAIITDPEHGVIIINGDATVSYLPEANYYGIDEFVYTICDTDGNCSQASVLITILPVNDEPEAWGDLEYTDEETPITIDVLANDADTYDPEGNIDNTTITIDTNPSNGTVEITEDGMIIYTPDENFNGEDEFIYMVCDDGYPAPGLCDTAIVIIAVAPVNDPPLAVDDMLTTDEDLGLDIPVLDNDGDDDGDNLDSTTLEVIVDPENGTITINEDGTVTYNPDEDYVGMDEFTYVICDDGIPQLCDTAVVTIEVMPINDSPIIVTGNGNPNVEDEIWGETLTTEEDVAFEVCFGLFDVDGSGASFDWENTWSIGLVNNGELTDTNDPSDTCFIYTPTANYFGTDTLQVVICDSLGLCDTVITYINILPVNDPPIAVDDTEQTDDVTDIIIDVIDNDTDPENDDLTVTEIDTSTGTEVTINEDGTITYYPPPGFCGYDTLTYVVCDDGWPQLCDTGMVVILVGPADSDGDGIPDFMEGYDLQTDTDGDNIPDYLDEDSDNDSIPDWLEGAPTYEDPCAPEVLDTDGDTVPDYLDPDSDNDNISDETEAGEDGDNPVDTDGDGTPDFQDEDSDNDTIPDDVENGFNPVPLDTDGDGIPDYQDEDSDGDGMLDENEAGDDPENPVDTDNDGAPDFQDVDSDGDTILDEDEAGDDPDNPVDTDDDGIPDYQDEDSDNDSIPDEVESDDGEPIDTDNDGIPDYQDEDSDDDGILDEDEAGEDPNNPVDTDNDGDPDFQDPDSDNDGIDDADEVGDPSDPTDTDGDGDPDYQDNDSDNDGIPDGYGPGEEAFGDCDGDGIPDFQDADACLEAQVIPEGISPNGDGVGDTWIIDFLIEYPNASVTIMNRWGTPVFTAQPYLQDFDGEGNTKGASVLPDGTYFYLIEMGVEGMDPIQGFLYIARD
jgi:large repetitive protein